MNFRTFTACLAIAGISGIATLAAALVSLLVADPVTARLLWVATAMTVAVGGGSLVASRPGRTEGRR
ncbi:hypothetical protein GCM10018980_51200 [Streptomyces capoamus]|uniref:Uncharacterized protein n=1 Tax=Streptomyces capoamus TaxID=68183 RepID=A0A919EZ60_9ACTN|nr:hypothetical protein [Streptomyces capoamus]GGW15858.1 hypothetical protein GCM10010501_29610 [Streptomyces libani subsp. rufus]GHG61780.1 hypothetical protein GCM10018980_51200 [Streptomyces capoamus]